MLRLAGEYQPVYDEFGSILLLVVTTLHRFDLSPSNHARDTPSFIARYIQSAHHSRPLQQLDEKASIAQGAWIRGLFETEGISDELMSISSPQDFHLGIATLFDQSIKACQMRILSLQTVKSGFDFILEPFLLPSLIAGLRWFSHKIWETAGQSSDLDTIIPILQHLLKPPSISSDARALHATVLSSVAKLLEEALNSALQQNPTRGDIGSLLDTVRAHNSKHRGIIAAYTELENWSLSPGGLLGALKSSMRHLAQWDISTTDLSAIQYTHRQIVTTQQLLGTEAVFNALLDAIVEVQQQGNSHMNEVPDTHVNAILDVATMIIVAPVVDKASSPSLVEHLRTAASEAYELSKADMSRAVTLVRLHRRVEALSFTQHNIPIAAEEQVAGMDDSQTMVVPTIDDVLAQADQNVGAQGFMNLDTNELMID